MKLREWLNNNSAVVMLIVVVVLVVTIGLIVMQNREPLHRPVVPNAQYFYDVQTGKVFVAGSSEIPPIDTESDSDENDEPAGARAHIYACGDCLPSYNRMGVAQSEEASAFIAYLEKFTSPANEGLEQNGSATPGSGPSLPGLLAIRPTRGQPTAKRSSIGAITS